MRLDEVGENREFKMPWQGVEVKGRVLRTGTMGVTVRLPKPRHFTTSDGVRVSFDGYETLTLAASSPVSPI